MPVQVRNGCSEFDSYHAARVKSLSHTSHAGLCAALRRDAKWVQRSARLFGANKLRSARSLARAARKRGGSEIGTGFGGHFRAVQGFKYVGSHEG